MVSVVVVSVVGAAEPPATREPAEAMYQLRVVTTTIA